MWPDVFWLFYLFLFLIICICDFRNWVDVLQWSLRNMYWYVLYIWCYTLLFISAVISGVMLPLLLQEIENNGDNRDEHSHLSSIFALKREQIIIRFPRAKYILQLDITIYWILCVAFQEIFLLTTWVNQSGNWDWLVLWSVLVKSLVIDFVFVDLSGVF